MNDEIIRGAIVYEAYYHQYVFIASNNDKQLKSFWFYIFKN